MKREVRSGLQVLRRTRSFLATIEAKPVFASVAKLLEELDGIVVLLLALAAEQESTGRSARTATEDIHRLERKLRREYLRPIARITRVAFPNDRARRKAVTVPAGVSMEALVAVTRGITSWASGDVERYVEHGLADTFVEQLNTMADALQKAVDTRNMLAGRRAGATQAIDRAYSRGRTIIVILDALVRPWIEVNLPDRLGEWDALSRFVREHTPSEGLSTPATPEPVTPIPVTPEAHAA
jgi:hypothetical protein